MVLGKGSNGGCLRGSIRRVVRSRRKDSLRCRCGEEGRAGGSPSQEEGSREGGVVGNYRGWHSGVQPMAAAATRSCGFHPEGDLALVDFHLHPVWVDRRGGDRMKTPLLARESMVFLLFSRRSISHNPSPSQRGRETERETTKQRKWDRNVGK